MVVRFRGYTTSKRVRVRVGIGTRDVLLVLVVLTVAVGLCCCNEEEEESNVEGEEMDEELRRNMHEEDEQMAFSAADIIASFPPPSVFQKWADDFGKTLYEQCSSATGLTDLQADYLIMKPRIEEVDGMRMIKDMKAKLETMLHKKVKAIKKLVEVAENSYSQHIVDDKINISYPKAKGLNLTEFPLTPNSRFNGIAVNLQNSSVHVPTNVYNASIKVLNGVSWTQSLDAIFRENYDNDSTLSWQYFGSSDGFFRIYPGISWIKRGAVDMYDCRTERWYIQAASSPKDVIILMDISGSMTGQRNEIAKATVMKILDTLSDEDYFNVIRFSNTLHYLDSCFNGTVVPANAYNKRKVQEILLNKTLSLPEGIANFEKALTEAFDIFNSLNATDPPLGSACNRAIMLITDGAPTTNEDIFKKYNWPHKNVRVFSFLIGREATERKQIEWMACVNKGQFDHISTRADVHEHVQEYIPVLSRPMALSQMQNPPVWTGIHNESVHAALALNLVVSVSQPIFDTRNLSNPNMLLGVMGTDIPITEWLKLMPAHRLGVNGYAFAITNNGYLLFHRDHRPMHGNLTKPNYNNIDLAEVEFEYNMTKDAQQQQQQQNTAYLDPNYGMDLRTYMINRTEGQLKMMVKVHTENMTRVAIRNQNYFFASIENTPFSIGISLPDGYGMHRVNGSLRLDENTDLSAFSLGSVRLANWTYCHYRQNESKHPVEALLTYLTKGKNGHSDYKDRCDMELVESLLFDVEVTRGALASWMKENFDGSLNDEMSRGNGIELVFLGTKAGLTRHLRLAEKPADPEFIDRMAGTIREPYYERAVEVGDGSFAFSVPRNAGDMYRSHFNFKKIAMTASSPVHLVEGGAKKAAVASVVGVQMTLQHFVELFVNITSSCGDNCNFSCDPELGMDCIILDHHGYIVYYPNSPVDIGKFFGELDGTMMKELIIDERKADGKTRGIFKRIQMFDYQDYCEIWAPNSRTSRLFSPIRFLVHIAFHVVKQMAWFVIHLVTVSVTVSTSAASEGGTHNHQLHELMAAAEGENSSNSAAVSDYESGSLPASSESEKSLDERFKPYLDRLDVLMRGQTTGIDEMRKHFRTRLNELSSNFDPAAMESFVSMEEQKFALRLVAQYPCTKRHSHVIVQLDRLPVRGLLGANATCLPACR